MKKNLKYLKFFEEIDPNTKDNFRMEEWTTKFKDFNTKLDRKIDDITGQIRGKICDKQNAIEKLKKDLEENFAKIQDQDLSDARTQTLDIYEARNEFLTILKNIVDPMSNDEVFPNNFPRLVEDLEKLLIEKFKFKINFDDIKSLSVISTMFPQDNYNQSAILFKKDISLLVGQLRGKYQNELQSFTYELNNSVTSDWAILTKYIVKYYKNPKNFPNFKFIEEKLMNITRSKIDLLEFIHKIEQEIFNEQIFNEALNKDGINKNDMQKIATTFKNIAKNIKLLQSEIVKSVLEIKELPQNCINYFKGQLELLQNEGDALQEKFISNAEKEINLEIRTFFDIIINNTILSRTGAITELAAFLKILKMHKLDLNNLKFIYEAAANLKTKLIKDNVAKVDDLVGKSLDNIIVKAQEIKNCDKDLAITSTEWFTKVSMIIDNNYNSCVQSQTSKIFNIFINDIRILINTKNDKEATIYNSINRIQSLSDSLKKVSTENISLFAKDLLNIIDNQKDMGVFASESELSSIEEEKVPVSDAMIKSLKLLTDYVEETITVNNNHKKEKIYDTITIFENDINNIINVERVSKSSQTQEDRKDFTERLSNLLTFKLNITIGELAKQIVAIMDNNKALFKDAKSKKLFEPLYQDTESSKILKERFENIKKQLQEYKEQGFNNIFNRFGSNVKEIINKYSDEGNFNTLREAYDIRFIDDAIKTLKFIESKLSEQSLGCYQTIGSLAEYLIKHFTDTNQLLADSTSKNELLEIKNDKNNRDTVILAKLVDIAQDIKHNNTIERYKDIQIKYSDAQLDIFAQGMTFLLDDIKAHIIKIQSKIQIPAKSKLEDIKKLKTLFNSSIKQTVGGTADALLKIQIFDIITSKPFFESVKQSNLEIRDKNKIDAIDNYLNNTLSDYRIIVTEENAATIVLKFASEVTKLLREEIDKKPDIPAVIKVLELLKQSLVPVYEKPDLNIGELAEHLINNVINKFEYLKCITHKNSLEEIKHIKIAVSVNIKYGLVELYNNLEPDIKWYHLLQNIYNNLSQNKFAFNSEIRESYKNVNPKDFRDFLTKIDIKNDYIVNLDEGDKKQELDSITQIILNNLDFNKPQVKDNKLRITGSFIKISDVLGGLDSKAFFIEIIALNAIYFDCNIIKPGVSFAILSPNWYIPEKKQINLTGVNAQAHSPDKASSANGYDANGCGKSGSHGLPGNPGQSAGHFYGVCGSQSNPSDIAKLQFITNGGAGSNGQAGGDGYPGRPGGDAGLVYEDYKNKEQRPAGSALYIRVPDISYGLLCRARNVEIYRTLGTFGCAGGNGGVGGIGGIGGKKGTVKIYQADKPLITHSGIEGNNGYYGSFGLGNIGGLNGKERKAAWDTRDRQWVTDPGKIRTIGSTLNCDKPTNASHGVNGSAGTNSTGQQIPYDPSQYFNLIKNDIKKGFETQVEFLSKPCQSKEFYKKFNYPIAEKFYRNFVKLSGNGPEIENTFDYHPFFDKYYSEAFDQILKLRLVGFDIDKSKIHILDARYLFDGTSDDIKQIVEKVHTILNEDQSIALVPYNLNQKHWVGFIFEKQGDHILIHYIDPQNTSMPLQIRDSLSMELPDENININELAVKQQTAGNCGPEVIENFIEYVTGHRVNQEIAVLYHSYLLERTLLNATTLGETVEIEYCYDIGRHS